MVMIITWICVDKVYISLITSVCLFSLCCVSRSNTKISKSTYSCCHSEPQIRCLFWPCTPQGFICLCCVRMDRNQILKKTGSYRLDCNCILVISKSSTQEMHPCEIVKVFFLLCSFALIWHIVWHVCAFNTNPQSSKQKY